MQQKQHTQEERENKWKRVFRARLLRALETRGLSFILEAMERNDHNPNCGSVKDGLEDVGRLRAAVGKN